MLDARTLKQLLKLVQQLFSENQVLQKIDLKGRIIAYFNPKRRERDAS